MHSGISIGSYLLTSLLAGLLGILAMETVMWAICRAEWARGSMVVAIGSLVTRTRENAWRVGAGLHLASAIGFALVYVFAMTHLGLARFPTAIFVGIGFGVLHGIMVSLMLVWLVAEQHPLEEFQEAGLAVGLSHFAGHVAYGAAVGLVIALASLGWS